MQEKTYFHRVTEQTETRFWINNVTEQEANWAIEEGATGCTQNPAYVWKMMQKEEMTPKIHALIDKYKELEFYTGVQGEEPAENIVYAERNDTITGDSITYSVNDGAIAYQATVRFGNDIGIQFSDEVRPMMYLKFMVVCLAAMGIFGVRIFLGRRQA